VTLVGDFGEQNVREQHNYGSGTFVGRDNYNIHNQVLDSRTREVLSKLSEDAPSLASLLRRSLQEGFISPDIAMALQMAVRNINEDVADALLFAGQNINKDVAWSLQEAGMNINKEVANGISQSATTLKVTTDRLCNLSPSLAALNDALIDIDQQIKDMFEPPSSENSISGVSRVKVFFYGVLTGVLICVAILIFYLVKH